MKKQIPFPAEDKRLDEKIEGTLNRSFPLPENVEAAKKRAFESIRSNQIKQDYANDIAKKQKSGKRRKSFYMKSAAGLVAAAAMFSVVCISNPALAEQIPLIGHIFEEIGSSLGFSGDYSKYAEPLSEITVSEKTAQQSEKETVAAVPVDTDGQYSSTADGVTVTLSEVYCNDAALNISMLIESESPFPESFVDQFGKIGIYIPEAQVVFSYNPETSIPVNKLQGEMLDDCTFAGVLRIDLENTGYSMDGQYESHMEVPEEFSAEINFTKIAGYLAEGKLPEMPQELIDEYNAAMAEYGLVSAEYENFTDEEKEIEHQLSLEMHRKYDELYPDAMKMPNKYENWWFEGNWDFEIPVKKNHEDVVVKEINITDEHGLGVASVMKTPFEITVASITPEPAYDYFTVVTDADGDLLPSGGAGNAEIWAIQDRDVSKIDVYICDYIEYMDELKGYYWSEDYEEKRKTKTFKELLDERALYHTEVIFE